MTRADLSHRPLATIIFLDPGESTGIAVLAIEPKWMTGRGDADWAGLRKAIKHHYFVQVGFDRRWWNGAKAVRPDGEEFEDLPERVASGPEITTAKANELQQVYDIRAILDDWPAAAWGFEDYVPESMAAAQKGPLISMRICTALAFQTIMDDQRPRVPFVQDRSFKSSAGDARMRDAGLYLPGMPHATDAARHAAVFARRCRQKADIRALAWPGLFGKEGKFVT